MRQSEPLRLIERLPGQTRESREEPLFHHLIQRWIALLLVVGAWSAGDLDLPLTRLRYIAEGKTGSLFGWCGVGASILGENPEAGARFRDEVLARGGSRPAMESFIAFRGREPQLDALLRHNGMTTSLA